MHTQYSPVGRKRPRRRYIARGIVMIRSHMSRSAMTGSARDVATRFFIHKLKHPKPVPFEKLSPLQRKMQLQGDVEMANHRIGRTMLERVLSEPDPPPFVGRPLSVGERIRLWFTFRLKPFLYMLGVPVRERSRESNIQL